MSVETKVEWGTAPQEITADGDFSKPSEKELVKVDLACGSQKREGFVGVDAIQTDVVDVVHDLSVFPWPFEDNSIYEMSCCHYVEHIPVTLADGSFGLHRFMEEAWRCLMPSGTITIVAPYFTSIRAWQDPTHVRAITELTFDYYNKDKAKAMNVGHYAAKCNFQAIAMTYALLPEYEPLAAEAREWARKHYFNVVADIQFVLRKLEL